MVAVAELSASNLAFTIVFSLFIAAFLGLSVITLLWAIRRDRRGRAAWQERQVQRAEELQRPPAAPNGKGPHGRDGAGQ
jgi:uncharacterized membrane protein